MANALVSLQILPQTQGESVIPYVDKAIAMIRDAGVRYRVSPLETTMEGELQTLLTLVGRIHEVMATAGCTHVIGQVKIYYRPAGASMEELTKKYD